AGAFGVRRGAARHDPRQEGALRRNLRQRRTAGRGSRRHERATSRIGRGRRAVNLSQATHASTAPTFGAEVRAGAVYAFTGALALLLQTTVLHTLTAGRVIPDLALVLCVYLGLHEHSVAGATGAFLLGYLLDSFSGSLVGLNAFAMTSVYTLVYLISRRLWMDN